MPNIDETIEWVAQHHCKCSAPGVDDYCGNCGGGWPCVPKRLADEVEQLQKNYDLAASVVAELTNQETEEDKGRLCTEIEQLREALMLPLLFHAGGQVTTEMRNRWKKITGYEEMTAAVMCGSIRVILAVDKIPDTALEGTDSATIDENLSDA